MIQKTTAAGRKKSPAMRSLTLVWTLMLALVLSIWAGPTQPVQASDFFVNYYDYFYYTSNQPYSVAFSSVKDTSLKVSWSSEMGYYTINDWMDVAGFKVQLKDIATGEVITRTKSEVGEISGGYHTDAEGNTSFTDYESKSFAVKFEKLKPGTKYKARVCGYVMNNGKVTKADWTEWISVCTCPGKVTGVKASYVSKGKMKVSWNAAVNAKGYFIQYSTSKNFTTETTNVVKVSKSTKSKTIGGLAARTYYVRVAAMTDSLNVSKRGAYSSKVTVTVKSGLSLKGMINFYTYDTTNKAQILQLTNNSVNIAKYTNNYDAIRAIFHWHAVHGLEFDSCMHCNTNFNDCIYYLFNGKRKYDNYILLGAGYFQNRSGSQAFHQWSVLNFGGVPYIFDPRMQAYTSTSGYDYFGVGKSDSLAKRFLFEGWSSWYWSGYEYYIIEQNS
ncbi:MAG: fibronectin type III domain-containing protein [Lachnospiraceae bacterium]